MRVGFIGLGAMGLPMAKNVLAAGYELMTTFHRRRDPAEKLVGLGALLASDYVEIARWADVVITVLPADAQLREVVMGKQGLVQGFTPGKVLIDMTTATPTAMLEVEAAVSLQGAEVLDAPVSGGTTAAADGTLTIMVGGDKDLLGQYRSLLETMGKTIVHVGSVGQGKVVKMVNQAMAGIHLLAMAEAFSLGVRCGADPKVLYDVIKASSGYSRQMDLRLPGFLLEGKFEPGFKLDLMKKDINLAIDSAQALDMPLFLTSMAAQVFAAASTAGLGELDFAAAAQFLVDTARAKLHP